MVIRYISYNHAHQVTHQVRLYLVNDSSQSSSSSLSSVTGRAAIGLEDHPTFSLSLHSFMRSSRAELIIAAVSWLALRERRPTSCNVSSTRQHESSRTRASSTRDSLISGEVSYTGWMLSTGFGSEFASDICTRWLLNTCLLTANPSPASLAVATCDRLTVVISISHVWDLLRTYGGRSFAYAGLSSSN